MKHINVALFAPNAGCPHACAFCDQRSISGAAAPLTPAAVTQAAETALATLPPGTAAAGEIAFFGGSFTLLPLFAQAEIPVIRVGLHASRDVEARMIGGAYHPALRELTESRILRNHALAQLQGNPPGGYRLTVAPRSQSKMIGQKRENIQFLRAAGYRCAVAVQEGLAPWEVLITQDASLI